MDFLYLSYEAQRQTIWHSYGFLGTSMRGRFVRSPAMAAIAFNTADQKSQSTIRAHAPSKTPPADQPAKVTAEFRPLDAGIVTEAIPAFFIGRNKEGFWVARDAKGKIGGIFLLRSSAQSFARESCRPEGCATIFLSERFELDLENSGNPLVPYLSSWMPLARRVRQQTAGLIGKMTEVVQRRLDGLHVL